MKHHPIGTAMQLQQAFPSTTHERLRFVKYLSKVIKECAQRYAETGLRM